ncbi:hypothetical protein CS8_091960 [Cupriavidus sp. 8B]
MNRSVSYLVILFNFCTHWPTWTFPWRKDAYPDSDKTYIANEIQETHASILQIRNEAEREE